MFKSMSRGEIEYYRKQYPAGTRIKLNAMDDPYNPVPPGTLGTVQRIDDVGNMHMQWDNGRTLALVIGHDSFSIVQPEPTTMKLYMPLTADAYERNEWGDMENEPTPMTDREILSHEDSIIAALVKNRMPEESERGIMHWYHENDSVDKKVKSCVFTAEARNGKLWGVAECRVVGELTASELDTLKEYISGQASDGWGEGFEQREIETHDGGEMYVHLWNFDDTWSILTESERFAPKYAEGLPEMCYSVQESTGDLIVIKRGEAGYYDCTYNTDDKQKNVELADYNNAKLGVTPEQRKAMEIGSLCGWDVPGADPANYHVAPCQQKGGMTFG
ncbi:DUF4314 domain-containing protein [Oscillibacter sp.]|uniref:DUF4314 domain-containing protein n=1 Tax=Oscillibacter sp. TaxID=1945593 RepID=UPI001B71B89C|nr:DUF4314 domain-containing protein [Oscillibacter sp.]MBP3508248.1 DUF4314 domain-containing protein [Oscillibacter sp.]